MRLNWKTITPRSAELRPPARWGHSCCTIKDSLYIFGGFANSTYMNDLWQYDLIETTWRQIKTTGDIPQKRSNSTLCYDDINNQLLLFGGGGPNKQRFNSISILDLSNNNWVELSPFQNQPAPWERTYHAAEFKFPYLFIMGGQNTDDIGDVWAYDINALTWTELKPKGDLPCARRFHSSCLVDNQIYVFGGCHGKYNCLNDFHKLNLQQFLVTGNPESLRWDKVSIQGTIQARWGHSLHHFNNALYVFGGRSSDDMNDLFRIDLDSYQITEIETDKKPSPRRRHGGGFIGSSLVMFGGFDGNYFNDLFYINLFNTKNQAKMNIPQIQSNSKFDSQITTNHGIKFSYKESIISRYFDSQFRLQQVFINSIDNKYSYFQLEESFESLYRGYGKTYFNTEDLALMNKTWSQGQVSKLNLVYQIIKKQPVLSIVQDQANCVYLSQEDFNFYTQCVKGHWSMTDEIETSHGTYMSVNFKTMAYYSQYISNLLSLSYKIEPFQWFKHCSFSQDIIEILLTYLHTGILVVPTGTSQQQFLELAAVSEYLCITKIVAICEEELCRLVTGENYKTIAAHSQQFDMKTLHQICALRFLDETIRNHHERIDAILLEEEKKTFKKAKQLYHVLKFDLYHNKTFSVSKTTQNEEVVLKENGLLNLATAPLRKSSI